MTILPTPHPCTTHLAPLALVALGDLAMPHGVFRTRVGNRDINCDSYRDPTVHQYVCFVESFPLRQGRLLCYEDGSALALKRHGQQWRLPDRPLQGPRHWVGSMDWWNRLDAAAFAGWKPMPAGPKTTQDWLAPMHQAHTRLPSLHAPTALLRERTLALSQALLGLWSVFPNLIELEFVHSHTDNKAVATYSVYGNRLLPDRAKNWLNTCANLMLPGHLGRNQQWKSDGVSGTTLYQQRIATITRPEAVSAHAQLRGWATAIAVEPRLAQFPQPSFAGTPT